MQGLRISGLLGAGLVITAAAISVNLRFGADQRPAAEPVVKLQMEKTAEFDLGGKVRPLYVVAEVSAGILFVADVNQRKVGRLALKADKQIKWQSLDEGSCSSADEPVHSLEVLRTVPYLLIHWCGRLAVIDKTDLSVVRMFGGGPRDWLFGLAVSPDERLIALAFRRQQTPTEFVRIHRVQDWAKEVEWEGDLAALRFTPDGMKLAAPFARNRRAGDLFATECGVRFYNPLSGQVVLEWSRSVEDPPCPEPLFQFVSHVPEKMVTTNAAEGGLTEWEAKTGTIVKTFEHEGYRVPLWLTVSGDGKLLAGDMWAPRSSRAPQYDFVIWDVTTGKQVYRLPYDKIQSHVWNATFPTEENYIVIARGTKIQLYRYRF